jgi:hypothetical protein
MTPSLAQDWERVLMPARIALTTMAALLDGSLIAS